MPASAQAALTLPSSCARRVILGRRRLVDVVLTWYRESAIEYDVGAVRHPALLPLSTASRVVISEAPPVGGQRVTEEADDGPTAGALLWPGRP
jgi:hypothetical protein